MGRFYDDAPDHEGYMERELAGAPDDSYLGHFDETTGSWWCASWKNGLPAPTGRWRPACSCSWKGSILDAEDIAAIDPDYRPHHDILDDTVEDLLMGPWSVHVRDGRSTQRERLAVRVAERMAASPDHVVVRSLLDLDDLALAGLLGNLDRAARGIRP